MAAILIDVFSKRRDTSDYLLRFALKYAHWFVTYFANRHTRTVSTKNFVVSPVFGGRRWRILLSEQTREDGNASLIRGHSSGWWGKGGGRGGDAPSLSAAG